MIAFFLFYSITSLITLINSGSLSQSSTSNKPHFFLMHDAFSILPASIFRSYVQKERISLSFLFFFFKSCNVLVKLLYWVMIASQIKLRGSSFSALRVCIKLVSFFPLKCLEEFTREGI